MEQVSALSERIATLKDIAQSMHEGAIHTQLFPEVDKILALPDELGAATVGEREAIAREQQRLRDTWVRPGVAEPGRLQAVLGEELKREARALDLLARPNVRYEQLAALPGLVGAETQPVREDRDGDVLLLFLLLFGFVGLRVALSCRSNQQRLVAIGCTTLLVGQSILNIAVASGAMPTSRAKMISRGTITFTVPARNPAARPKTR